ncbi:hypothetical protein HMPREF3196_01849 [Bifidobacterium bifidum]|uniref:Uncharacterized protein n=1 Tax=Bifidobacterium bifidum TaxID=1681 RepID=A0A133KLB8_BIFBI|nr:hypothetical protein HMPREF3196_01849 [Bifidobacterium bifidum]
MQDDNSVAAATAYATVVRLIVGMYFCSSRPRMCRRHGRAGVRYEAGSAPQSRHCDSPVFGRRVLSGA